MIKSIGSITLKSVLLLCLLAVFGCETANDISVDASPDNGTESAGDNGNEAANDGGSGGGGGGSDAISLSGVVWLDTNVSGWSRTATLNASVGGGMINLPYDKANVWPTTRTRASDGGPLNGNCWVFVQVNGTWHAATFDWMRTGQTAKAAASVRGTGGHIPRAPLNTWTPRSGETIGFMVSTPARTADRTINERSNVSMVTWP